MVVGCQSIPGQQVGALAISYTLVRWAYANRVHHDFWRFLEGKKFMIEKYLEVGNTVQYSKLMELRLNMFEVKMNYKNKYKEDMKWKRCKKEDEMQEVHRAS